MDSLEKRKLIVKTIKNKLNLIGLKEIYNYKCNLGILESNLENPDYFSEIQELYFPKDKWNTNTSYIPFHLGEEGYDLDTIVDDKKNYLETLIKRPDKYKTTGIIIANPYSSKLESWTHIYNDDYQKHRGANKNASQFLEKDLSFHLERLTFFYGKGVLKNLGYGQLSMFLRFNRDIGKLSNGKSSSIVRIYVTRKKRNRSTGYIVTKHGFPISESEVKRSSSLRNEQKISILENKYNI